MSSIADAVVSRQNTDEKARRIARQMVNASLFGVAALAFCSVGFNKYQNGWLRIVDLYVLIFGGVLFLCIWFPLAVKTNVLALLIVIGATEGLFGLLNRVVARPMERIVITNAGAAHEYAERDDLLGFKLKPSTTVEVEKFVDSKRIYRAQYSIDDHGRRAVPVAAAERRENFVLFFGCSFTYGEGLNDDETLPSFVGRLAPDYRPYNYAVGGYGPQHMLARLESGRIEAEVTERTGKLVYVFIDDHVKRAMNTMRTDWVHHSPYYVADPSGRAVRQGNFNSARPYLYALYHDVLPHSQILRFLNMVDFPLTVSDADIELTAKIIEASAKQFFDRFGSKEFYVLLHPVGSSLYGSPLKKYLEKSAIKYIDYSGKLPWAADYYLDPVYDLHPNAVGNRLLAAKLVGDLGLVAKKGRTVGLSPEGVSMAASFAAAD